MRRALLVLSFAVALPACSCGRSPAADDAGTDSPLSGPDVPVPLDSGADAAAGECLAGLTYCREGAVLVCGPDGAIVSTTPCPSGTVCSSGACVDPCDAASAGSSHEGCHFRSTAPPSLLSGHGGPRLPELGYGLHNPGAADATVTIAGGTLLSPVEVTVPARGSAFATVPLIGGVFDRAVYGVSATVLARETASYTLDSDVPIVAYEFSPDYGLVLDEARFLMKADATILLPVHAWGTEYVAVTMPPQCLASPCNPEEMTFLQVVAGTDGTMVEIDPSAVVEASVEAVVTSTEVVETPVASLAVHAPGRYMLDAGDVLQLVSAGDLTGTKVTASAPIQLVSGNVGIRLEGRFSPLGDGHAHDAILPLRAWGASYVVAPPPHPTRDEALSFSVRVVAGDTPAELTFDPPVHAPMTLGARGYADLPGLSEAFQVSSTAPVLVVVQSTPSDVPTGDSLDQPFGAASMVALPPFEQWRADYAFSVPVEFDYAHVTVIQPSSATVMLDGVAVTGTRPIGTTGWSYASVRADPGSASHRATSTEGFGLLVYGQAAGSSYWYAAGLDAEELF